MKRNYLLTGTFLLMAGSLMAQEKLSVSFTKEKDTVRRSATEVILATTIKIEAEGIENNKKTLYSITAKVDEGKSTLAPSAYTIDFNTVSLDKASKEYTFYIRIKQDDEADRDRLIYLNIALSKEEAEVTNAATGATTLVLVVEGSRILNSYNYLAYVGTNFDLVDGVQAKNLFFATTIFSPPVSKGQGIGINLTLYGNRTTTTTDTSGRVSYPSKIVPIGGDSARYYTENALKTVNRVSDNLGASFSPIVRIGRWSQPNRVIQVYYAPQFEFIWRRTVITTQYTDAHLEDSSDRPNRPFSRPLILTEPVTKTPLNIYDAYLGLAGVLINHENKYVSVRVQAALGLNVSYIAGRGGATRGNEIKVSYDKDARAFFYARAWITEPISGITIGAEVSNNLFNKDDAQPYYNVTLSKAINLSSLAAVFKPVTAR